MASLEEIRRARLEKLNFLVEEGINPYPASVNRDLSCAEASVKFDELTKDDKSLYLVGRIMSVRSQGGLSFIDIDDGTGRFQVLLKRDDPLPKESFELFTKAFDIGDFVEVKGTFFLTKKQEKTLLAVEIKMVSKSLRPLPEKWHGLQDQETRFRQRYLDLLFNPEMRKLFFQKESFWSVVRDFMKKEGFLEVETPTLELTTGGAEAEPFTTRHNDFDLDVHLRISVGELWQKRLLAAGFTKTFEIGRIYRNEGSSPEHLQEFTNMEFYWSYADYRNGMDFVKRFYRTIAKEVFGRSKFSTRGHTFDLDDEWVEIDYVEEVKRQTDLDVISATEEDMRDKLGQLGVKYQGETKERLIDSLWKHCRKNIAGPAFLLNHPVLVGPLAKQNKDGKSVQMFQPLLAGSEVGRGYSELNDPLDQRERFLAQNRLIEAGDKEAMMPDWEFVEMLEYGMPPACGFGFGERLFAFLADRSLREVQLFPLMKPKEE